MKKTILAVTILLLTAVMCSAQTTVTLQAQRMTALMPDGKTVPMWGYANCPVDTTTSTAVCPDATAAAQWAPGPTIYAKAGTDLTINLTNALPTPTSIVILGQIGTGGGLGSPTMQASPVHAGSSATTWPAAADGSFTPPAQGPRVRSFGMETGSGAQASYVWKSLKAGTYLYETGTHPSIQAPMGLYGVLVVTVSDPAVAGTPATLTPGVAYTGQSYDADVPLLLSEVDPVQNAAVDATAVATAGCAPIAGACSGTINEDKYPHAVDYKPLYFLLNGKAFDKTAPNTFPVAQLESTGNVLLRFVNAGLRTHIPTAVNLPLSLIAEDGNLLPGIPKVQSEILLTAGKTIDAIVHPPLSAAGAYAANTYSIFDRQLSLSNGNRGDGGIQGYLQVAGAALPQYVGASAQVVNDNFTVALNTTSYNGNVLANDLGVTSATIATQPTNGTVTLNSDGTFTYTPNSTPLGLGFSDTFTYYGNNNTAMVATVTIGVSSSADAGAPTAQNQTYTSNVQSLFKLVAPGVLVGATSPKDYKLSASLPSATVGQPFTVTGTGSNTATVTVNADGSLTAIASAADRYSFQYTVTNAQGVVSAPASVTITFPVGNGPMVTVQDAQSAATTLDDYKWTIEQDITWPTDPTQQATSGTDPDQSLGTNFHKSYMPVIATGCTGPKSCGDDQTVGGVPVAARPRSYPQDVVLNIDSTPGSTNNRFYISVLPGDGADGGHTVGGSSFAGASASVTVTVEPQPLQTAQLSVYIFEDNNPTNGDADDGEPGLGGFQITLFDVRASTGDPAGQMTYDALGMPLSNALLGTPGCPGSVPPGTPQGVIVTCPEGSPLAGMALIKNLMPLRYDVIANPGAARASRGETWYQVSTLEGTFAQDAFAKVGEPTYFQEFGAPGFHSFIGFVNPDHIKAVNTAYANGAASTATVTGKITNLHMDRPPAINLWDSGTRDALNFTTCYVGLNSADGQGADVAFATCDQDGNFSLANVPPGTYSLVAFDQWLDQIIAYKEVTVPANAGTVAMGDVAVFSWFTNVVQSAYLDLNKNGVRDQDEPGIPQIPMTIRFRDGSISNLLFTDSDGAAPFNQLFPLFNWYVVESDTTRFKGTGVHVAVDAGGPVNCDSNTSQNVGTTSTTTPSFCNDAQAKADYEHILNPQQINRVDPGTTYYEGLQGFISQTEVLDWGKTPYLAGENGGIQGMVYYAPTRGFDDPSLEVQFSWSPAVPRVPVNLYQEITNADGTTSLTLVDQTTTSSWDDVAPTMHCPGDSVSDPFVQYTIGTAHVDKCYDGQHNFNQVQPAAYDGRYRFPSAAYSAAHPGANGLLPSLPPGKYVVEVVPPAGYEIVKEEDKNILIGDAWIAPVTQQFGGLGNLFILPDQATLDESVIPTQANTFPVCVGDLHRVPDFLNLFPAAQQYAPFAGQDRPLCNRKEVSLEDQMQANADFQVFTPAPIAAHFTGMILNDAAAEFNQVSPSFGEKEALPNAPVSIKDFNGIEIQRVYTDKWGQFNGLTPSTWEANVPNPSGYSPNMLITCMNDPGPIKDTNPSSPTFGQMITDPMYNPMYSNFCYTWPFMPGITTYLDTPVLPVAAFAAKYNPVDCAYPTGTPGIRRVDGNGAAFGPFLDKQSGTMTLTIASLGSNVMVPNPDYSGPQATGAPTAQQSLIARDFSFGSTAGTVTLGNFVIPTANVVWGSDTITVTVPSSIPVGSYELGITRGDNGSKSVDTVTVTIDDSQRAGYRAPITVTPVTDANAIGLAHPIQDAIDAAQPGDLILVQAGSYPELVIMWKPVRLQGVGAPSVTVNATKYPTQKLESWRERINTLFGIDAQGNQTLPAVVDPLPGQEITGGVVLLEPSVLSSEEGAGITVLGKQDPTNANGRVTSYGPNSYWNHPSRIDGLTVTGGDSGGGIYVNGWAHNLEISNNRIHGNAGTYDGGVRIGQPYLEGLAGKGPFNFDTNVKIHHNAVTTNGTVEANAAAGTAAAASAGAGGGISICSGTDNYLVNYNFICGNFSSGDGGGLAHFGLSQNGEISNNKILFNQSYNQTSATNGGGLAIEGEPATGAGLSLGTGDVTVDSNLVQGNFAEGGSGGGVRLQFVNGNDVAVAPFSRGTWFKVTLTNNMVVNNEAGWAGGGIAIADALNTQIANNTIVSNDSTGIAGVVIGANGSGAITGNPNAAGISFDYTSAALRALLPDPGPKPSTPSVLWNTLAAPLYSAPSSFINNVIWQNRSFFFDGSSGTAQLCASNNLSDATASTKVCNTVTPPTNNPYACQLPNTKYWDLGVVGDASEANPQYQYNPTYSVITDSAQYRGTVGLIDTNSGSNPNLVGQYCNGSRTEFGQYWEPQQPFLASPSMSVSATLDEAGNFVSLTYGPLAQTDSTGKLFGDYHLQTTSTAAIDKGTAGNASLGFPPKNDYDNQARPMNARYDIGADETGAGVAITPQTLAFGDQVVGTTSQPLFVTLTNNGTASYTFTTSTAPRTTGNFAVAAGSCSGVLAAGSTCVVNVTFTPLTGGADSRTGSLIVAGQTVALSGTRTNGIVVNPLYVDFGNVTVGTTSPYQDVVVSNASTNPVTLTMGNMPARFARVTSGIPLTAPNCGSSLAAGANCTVRITFHPTAATVSTGTFAVSGHIVTLTGTGVAAALTNVTLSSLNFAPQVIFTKSAVGFVTITNNRAAAISLAGLSINGPNADQFARSGGTCGNALAAHHNCTVGITFTPTAPDTQTATLDVVGNSANLSGNGKYLSVAPNALIFSAPAGGASAVQKVTVTNGGNSAVTGIVVTPSDSTNYTVTSDCINLASGAACTISVTFNPATGTASATSVPASLTITYDQVTSTPETVALVGTVQ
jgi:hypothetical protein